MKIYSVLFESEPGYERMAQVLKVSTERNSPSTPVEIVKIESDDSDLRNLVKTKLPETYISNARKTRHHCNIVQEAKNGELLGLLDCDMLVLKDLSVVELYDFDLAYTPRPSKSHRRVNTGTIFIRVTDKTKEWYRRWYQNVLQLLNDRVEFHKWSKLYGGINQSGFGMLLESPHDLKLQELSCQEWNLIYDHWKKYNSNTRIVHIQGALRDAVTRKKSHVSQEVKRLAAIWREYERASKSP